MSRNDPDLTDRQMAILRTIRHQSRETGLPPSMRELAAAVGLRSVSAVEAQLRTLEGRGYIRRFPLVARAVFLDEKGAQALDRSPDQGLHDAA